MLEFVFNAHKETTLTSTPQRSLQQEHCQGFHKVEENNFFSAQGTTRWIREYSRSIYSINSPLDEQGYCRLMFNVENSSCTNNKVSLTFLLLAPVCV